MSAAQRWTCNEHSTHRAARHRPSCRDRRARLPAAAAPPARPPRPRRSSRRPPPPPPPPPSPRAARPPSRCTAQLTCSDSVHKLSACSTARCGNVTESIAAAPQVQQAVRTLPQPISGLAKEPIEPHDTVKPWSKAHSALQTLMAYDRPIPQRWMRWTEAWEETATGLT